MISRVSSRDKEKQAKRENRAKKQKTKRLNGKKKRYKETENAASPGVEPGSSAGASNSLTTAQH